MPDPDAPADVRSIVRIVARRRERRNKIEAGCDLSLGRNLVSPAIVGLGGAAGSDLLIEQPRTEGEAAIRTVPRACAQPLAVGRPSGPTGIPETLIGGERRTDRRARRDVRLEHIAFGHEGSAEPAGVGRISNPDG